MWFSSSCSKTWETSAIVPEAGPEGRRNPCWRTPLLLMKGRRSGGVPDADATPSNNPE